MSEKEYKSSREKGIKPKTQFTSSIREALQWADYKSKGKEVYFIEIQNTPNIIKQNNKWIFNDLGIKQPHFINQKPIKNFKRIKWRRIE